MINPLLLDISVPIVTPRLLLKPPQEGDSVCLYEALTESFEEISQWLPWATVKPTPESTKIYIRTAQANWLMRHDLPLLIFSRDQTVLLGGTGFHRIKWELPSFEIGYWVHSSYACQGIITESTNSLVRYAFKHLNALKIIIKCDEDNRASRKIAEKLGFVQEGILKKDGLKNYSQGIKNIVCYARYDCDNLPDLAITW